MLELMPGPSLKAPRKGFSSRDAWPQLPRMQGAIQFLGVNQDSGWQINTTDTISTNTKTYIHPWTPNAPIDGLDRNNMDDSPAELFFST